MKDIKKILSFTKYDTYNNARRMADDIVIVLMNNDTSSSPITFTSTVTVNPIYKIGVDLGMFLPDRNDFGKDEDDKHKNYVIKVYQVFGNRNSKLSIAQNKELAKIVLGDDDKEE